MPETSDLSVRQGLFPPLRYPEGWRGDNVGVGVWGVLRKEVIEAYVFIKAV